MKNIRFGLEGYLTELEIGHLGGMVESSAYFNPFAPAGHYNLNMAIPGERDVFRAILGLDKVNISRRLGTIHIYFPRFVLYQPDLRAAYFMILQYNNIVRNTHQSSTRSIKLLLMTPHLCRHGTTPILVSVTTRSTGHTWA